MNQTAAQSDDAIIDDAIGQAYKYGFETDIEMEYAPKGVSPDIVRLISSKKNEPEWMTDWRLKAFDIWTQMVEPDWTELNIAPIDYQDIYYYAAPKGMTCLLYTSDAADD